jgi:hypothetical protein
VAGNAENGQKSKKDAEVNPVDTFKTTRITKDIETGLG